MPLDSLFDFSFNHPLFVLDIWPMTGIDDVDIRYNVLCICSFVHSFVHQPTHSLTHTLTHSLIHSFIHSSCNITTEKNLTAHKSSTISTYVYIGTNERTSERDGATSQKVNALIDIKACPVLFLSM
jgi:hypothetical protein